MSSVPELRRQQNFEVALKLLEAIRGPFLGVDDISYIILL